MTAFAEWNLISQARIYLRGAVLATALVVAAVIGFVVLVSAGPLREWPTAEVGVGADLPTAVAGAERVPGGNGVAERDATGAAPAPVIVAATPSSSSPVPPPTASTGGDAGATAPSLGSGDAVAALPSPQPTGNKGATQAPAPNPAPATPEPTPPTEIVTGTPGGGVVAAVRETVSELDGAFGGPIRSAPVEIIEEVAEEAVGGSTESPATDVVEEVTEVVEEVTEATGEAVTPAVAGPETKAAPAPPAPAPPAG